MAKVLCEKFRDDALRVFISGLKRGLTDVLFAARPKDLPSALALAQEVESNHERYAFAANFSRSREEKECRPNANAQGHQLEKGSQRADLPARGAKNPHFSRQHKSQGQPTHNSGKVRNNNTAPETMEVDPSMSNCLMPSQAPAYVNSSNP